MATFTGALGPYYHLQLVVNVASQDIASNTSTLSWSLTIIQDNLSFNAWSSWTNNNWSVNINGTVYGGSTTYDFRSYNSLLLAATSIVVGHNADGTLSIGVSAAWDDHGGTSLNDGSLSSGMTLPTIPRASTPTFSPNPVDAGVLTTITTNRASSSFTHTITYSLGTASGTIGTGIGASTTWTPPLSLLNEIPNSTSGLVTITTQTFSGATLIGTKVTSLTLTVPTSVVPTFTDITHAENIALVSTLIGGYVQGLSKLDLAIVGAAGAYGSTISGSGYKIQVAGQTINAAAGTTPVPLAQSGTVTITATVTDSRGRSAQATEDITVLPYAPPQINAGGFILSRSDSGGTVDEDGIYIRVDLDAVVSSLVVSAVEKNNLYYKLYTRQRGDIPWTLQDTVDVGDTEIDSFDVISGTYAAEDSWEVKVEVYDEFLVATIVGVIATGVVFQHWDRTNNALAIGKFWEQGQLDVAGRIYQRSGFAVLDTDDLSDINDDINLAAGAVRYGTITGVDTTGITVTLEDGFGTITAIRRGQRYFPIVGNRVMVERSDDEYLISQAPKVAGAVRTSVPLTTNWTQYHTETNQWSADPGGPYFPATVYRTTNGIVKVSGLIRKWQGGAFSSGEKVATLPSGYRPDYPCVFATNTSAGGSSGRCRVVVDTDGSIYAIDGPTDSAYLSLDNVSFPVGLTWTAATLLNSFAATTSFAVPSGPTVTIPVPGWAVDSNGITWTRGGALRASDPSDNTAIFTYSTGAGPVLNSQHHFANAGHTVSALGYTGVGAQGSTDRNRRWRSPGSRGVFFDGSPFVSESSTLAYYGATTAIPIPLQPDGSTSYVAIAGWQPRAWLTPEGLVFLAGLGTGGTGTFGWMAPELRPQYRLLFSTMSNNAVGRMDIYVTGKVAGVTGSTWHSFDNLVYMSDPRYDLAYGGA